MAGLREALVCWNSGGAKTEKFINYTSRVGAECKFWDLRARVVVGLFCSGHAF
jgi:hypothetical protein